MGKYLISGNAGTGKSTIIDLLSRRGYNAYDIDELSYIHSYLDTKTNRVSSILPKTNLHDRESFKRYQSIIIKDGVQELLGGKETIFLGGSVTNQDQFYPLFTRIFALVLDNDTLEERLSSRTNNVTGNDPADRAYLLSINSRVQANSQAAGATLIDATRTSDQIADEILRYTHDG